MPVAAPLSVIVPVDVVPPATVEGLSVRVATPGMAAIVNVALADEPFAEAPIVAVTALRVTVVPTVKVAVVAPAATVTVAGFGSVAMTLLEVRLTTWPPVGAGPLRVTVAVDEFPERTDVGFNATLLTVGGLTVKVAVCGEVPVVAVIVSDFAAGTATVVTVKVVEVVPAGTETDARTVAEASLDVRLTVMPPVGAGPLSVIVPVEEVPPVTVAGLRATVVTVGALIVRGALLVAG